jgi:tetratricopeptide (TPR) repeat protein
MTEQMIDSGPAALPGAATASDADLARIPVAAGQILAAAAALTLAGRWDTARQLLASAQASGPGGATARRLALAAAATAVHHDFRTAGPRWAPDALAAAEKVVESVVESVVEAPAGTVVESVAEAGAGTQTAEAAATAATAAGDASPADRWDLDFLRLQAEYDRELVGADATPRFGPEGRDPARLAALARQAEALLPGAGDQGRGGWAAFYRGVIADNLIGDRDDARRWFEQALAAGEQAGDSYLIGEALRHLGDHDEGAGDLAGARAKWERSAEVWAAAGNVCGVLAQQLLLAHLALAEGQPAAGVAIATEVRRWARAAGLPLYAGSAEALIVGQQPGG